MRRVALSLALLMLALMLAPRAHADAPAPAALPVLRDDLHCLAATIHAESAGQSAETKTLVGYFVLERAVAARLSVCDWLRETSGAQSRGFVIYAYRVAERTRDSWTHGVYFHSDLHRRERGQESLDIAAGVLAWERAGYRHVAHFDSCDSRAEWAGAERALRLAESDTVCFWE